MTVFSYIYYRTYSVYKHKWKEEDPKIYSLALVSILQSLNILTFLLWAGFYFKTKIDFNKLYLLFLFLFLVFVNSIWFNKIKPFKKLEVKWESESKSKKRVKGILILVYIVFSLAAMYISAVYYGKNANNI